MQPIEMVCTVRNWSAQFPWMPWVRGLLLALSFVPYLTAADHIHGDVRLYHAAAMALLRGESPYEDFEFGYPPLALVWFVPPALLAGWDLEVFWWGFMVEMALFDLWIKVMLLRAGMSPGSGWRSMSPFLLYAVSCSFLRFHFLQRFDLVPAAFTLCGVLLLARVRWFWAGLALAIGAGTKVFPLFVLIPVVVWVKRRGGLGDYGLGVAVIAGPLLATAPLVPWWEFLTLQGGRGLQVESFYASILWMMHSYELVEVRWERVMNYYEIHGMAATALLAWAHLAWVAAVGISVVAAARRLLRKDEMDPGELGGIVVVPVLALVAFNVVLSPQYLVWLAPLVALAAWRASRVMAVGFVLVTALTPVIFPSPEYETGLSLFQTHVLVLRNLTLAGLWWIGLSSLWVKAGDQVT